MTALNSVRPRLTRRCAITGLVAAIAILATACTAGPRDPSAAGSSSAPSSSAGSANATEAIAEDGPAVEAFAAVAAARTFVENAVKVYPRLARRAAPLIALHQVHEEFLISVIGATPADATAAVMPAPGQRAAVSRGIAAAETTLAKTLADLALTAEDGPLARALASMSASTSQTATSVGWSGAHDETNALAKSLSLGAEETAAVQRVLEREHATLWWYGVLGGRTSGADQPELFRALTTGYAAHQRQRDQLSALLFGQGVTPVASEATYPIDWNLRSGSQNIKQTHRMEAACAAAYSWLVAESTGNLRIWAIEALRNAAIRDLAVQGTPENFPGAGELADH